MLPHSFDWYVVVYGFFSAFLSVFISYTLQPGEIFFTYSYTLSKWRLKRMGQWDQYENIIKDVGVTKEVKKIVYDAASEYFTWEKMIGMCVICSGFWISLVCGFFYTLDPVKIAEIVLISHVTIRILSKYL